MRIQRRRWRVFSLSGSASNEDGKARRGGVATDGSNVDIAAGDGAATGRSGYQGEASFERIV
ncbi:hypothetical protein VB151_08290 [Xanthomonas fragariae]|uniref:hypothetical protein n=1 Tax=Xanthomonas fragariae TaxID=48664 RepID=UPI001E3864F2|nr:hypothetical protein [Xanthomonas fragariae]MDM7554546.1 hypothetical protein [Xanthomonas fragariae]MDM7557662.1 hypothetical protein [Xanthomonas fragariae]MDM7572236.1 hypothetical protein [Xanthomonas fragariae]MDM7575347.1 hypothetical protein [Xanthomonas fragariae]MDM7578437.1 hypothetical protein [Xanthomonas fragariae]